jgi:pyruvate dehydrogenase E2 component (dihydrolipoamide acetyltransferase)
MPTELTMPKLGLTMTSGTLVRWLVEDGQLVSAGQALFEIETDKAVAEVKAPVAGVLRIVAPPGTVLPVGAVTGYLLAQGEALPGLASACPAPGGDQSSSVAHAPAPRAVAGRLGGPASPAAKRLARELGVDISVVPGSGEDGRVGASDVERFAAAVQPASQPARPQPAVALAPLEAEQPPAALRPASVTITTEADAGQLLALLDSLNGSLAERLGFAIEAEHLLVTLAARALRELPAVSARLDDSAISLPTRLTIALAIETSGRQDLVVLADADHLTAADVARTVHEQGTAGASYGGANAGGAFTVMALGVNGVSVCAFPAAGGGAGLAVGSVCLKPVAGRSGIELRPMIGLSLNFDHRVVDGAPAARFLRRVKELVQEPGLLLA